MNLVSNSPKSQFDQSELDTMTLILKLDPDVVKMSHHTKNEVSMFKIFKSYTLTDTQIDTQT